MKLLPQRWPRLRFSLRALLVLTTGFCLWFGYGMKRARDQAALVAYVHQCGGRVTYVHDEFFFLACGWGDDMPKSGPTWLRSILGDDYFVFVDSVSYEPNDSTPSTGRLRHFLQLASRVPSATRMTLDLPQEELHELNSLADDKQLQCL